MNPFAAFIAGVIALLQSLFGVRPYDVPAGTDIFTVVEGTWDWSGSPGVCRDNPHRITFSSDRREMVLAFEQPLDSVSGVRTASYDIRDTTRHSIRGFMAGETRQSTTGGLIVWDLVLTSPNSYRWRGTDWPRGSYTPEVVRCGARR